MKKYHIEIAIALFLVLAFGYGSIILYTSLQSSWERAAPTVERNEWGQNLPDNLEELCEGTVLQWSVRCERMRLLRKDI